MSRNPSEMPVSIIPRPIHIGSENIAKLRWQLPSNCTKSHPKLCKQNRKPECDFSNFWAKLCKEFCKENANSRNFVILLMLGMVEQVNRACAVLPEIITIILTGANITISHDRNILQWEQQGWNITIFYVAIFCNENGPIGKNLDFLMYQFFWTGIFVPKNTLPEKTHNFLGFLARKAHARKNLNLIQVFWQVVHKRNFTLLVTIVYWEGHIPHDQKPE